VEIRQERATTMGQNEPRPYCDFLQRHGSTKLLSSSIDRGWLGLSAELRTHRKSVVPWTGPRSDAEVCVDIRGSGCSSRREPPGAWIRLLPAAARSGCAPLAGGKAQSRSPMCSEVQLEIIAAERPEWRNG
jgi:hypothetical protein